MEHIWAPWRIEFILGEKPEGCFLCQRPQESDDRSCLILFRAERNFVILNRYPYNPGHLLIAPYSHVPTLEDLSDEETLEHFDLVKRCTRALRHAFQPAGFNIGINQGRTAGAGVADHMHTHVVPRWEGDTNFMPVVADTRILPQALQSTYDKLLGLI